MRLGELQPANMQMGGVQELAPQQLALKLTTLIANPEAIPAICNYLAALTEHVNGLDCTDHSHEGLSQLLGTHADALFSTSNAINNLGSPCHSGQLGLLVPQATLYMKQLVAWFKGLAANCEFASFSQQACHPSAHFASAVLQLAQAALFNPRVLDSVGVDSFRACADDWRGSVTTTCQAIQHLMMLIWQGCQLDTAACEDMNNQMPVPEAALSKLQALGSPIITGLLALGETSLEAHSNTSLHSAIRSQRSISVSWRTLTDMLGKNLPIPLVRQLNIGDQVSRALSVCLNKLEEELQAFQQAPKPDRLQVLTFWQMNIMRIRDAYPTRVSLQAWEQISRIAKALHVSLMQLTCNQLDSQGSPTTHTLFATDMEKLEKIELKICKSMLIMVEQAANDSHDGDSASASISVVQEWLRRALDSPCNSERPAIVQTHLAHSLLHKTVGFADTMCPTTLSAVCMFLVPWSLKYGSLAADQACLVTSNTPATTAVDSAQLQTICLSALLAICGNAQATDQDSCSVMQLLAQLITLACNTHPHIAHNASTVLCAAMQHAPQDTQLQILLAACHLLNSTAAADAMHDCVCGTNQAFPAAWSSTASCVAQLVSRLVKASDTAVVKQAHNTLGLHQLPGCTDNQQAAQTSTCGLSELSKYAYMCSAFACSWQEVSTTSAAANIMAQLHSMLQQAVSLLSSNPSLQETAPAAAAYMYNKVSWMLECMVSLVPCAATPSQQGEQHSLPPTSSLGWATASISLVNNVPSLAHSPAAMMSVLRLACALYDAGIVDVLSELLPEQLTSAIAAVPGCAPFALRLMSAMFQRDPDCMQQYPSVLHASLDQHWLLRHEALTAFIECMRQPHLLHLVSLLMSPAMRPPTAGETPTQLAQTLLTYTKGKSEHPASQATITASANTMQMLSKYGGQYMQADYIDLNSFYSALKAVQQLGGATGMNNSYAMSKVIATAQSQCATAQSQLESIKSTVDQLVRGIVSQGQQISKAELRLAKESTKKLAGDLHSLACIARGAAEQVTELAHRITL